MASIPNEQRMPSISMDGLVTIVGAVLLLLAIIYFNNDLHYRLDTKIDTVRAELKADIDDVRSELSAVRAELKADIENVRMELSADIQRLDDRLFAIVSPPVQAEEDTP